MSEETKQKLVAKVLLSPMLREDTLEAEGRTNGSALGELLRRMLGNDDKILVLTKDKHGDYVRGLADGGMMCAHRLFSMLEKADRVEVTVHMLPKD